MRFETPMDIVDPATVGESLRDVPGLYLHVPFCESLCPFCPYNKVRHDCDRVAAYFQALGIEVERMSAAAGSFASLYVGGGTPTLCLDELERLVSRIDVLGERAIEVLPGHATAAGVARIEAAGFDTVSLGVQSFDAKTLRRLGRPNTVAENHAAIEASLGAFECVDVDLIFDAAVEDEAVFLEDVRTCAAAGVDQISTYPLMRFGYTPFGKASHLPELEHRMLRNAADLASIYGYRRGSVWTLNRAGGHRYTSITREFYLGAGAGAASFTGDRFLANHFGLGAYGEAVAAGGLPVARSAALRGPAATAYWLFWQLYSGSVDLDRMSSLFRWAWLFRPALSIGVSVGWLRRSSRLLLLTPAGFDRYHDLERWVTYRFIEPLWAELTAERIAEEQDASLGLPRLR